MNQKEARKLNKIQFHVDFGEPWTRIYVSQLKKGSCRIIEAVLTPLGWEDEFTEELSAQDMSDGVLTKLSFKESMELREIIDDIVYKVTGERLH